MYLGIDLGGTKCMFAVEYDKIRIFKKYPTGIEFTKERLITILTDFASYASTKINVSLKQNITYIVASLCGLLDSNGIIGLCELPKLTGTNIKQLISSELKISTNSISIVNDGYAALHACMELYPNETNMATIIYGTGIGSSFIIDGTILECNTHIAGWVGASPITIINNNNKRETKTLDEICGGRAIVNALKPILPNDIINNNIDDEKDKEKIIKILNDAGYYMGIGICICLNMMKCKRIIFGGGVFNFKYIYDAMIKSINENMIVKELVNNCKMELCRQNNELVCIGALTLAKNRDNDSDSSVAENHTEIVENGQNQSIIIIDQLLSLLQ